MDYLLIKDIIWWLSSIFMPQREPKPCPSEVKYVGTLPTVVVSGVSDKTAWKRAVKKTFGYSGEAFGLIYDEWESIGRGLPAEFAYIAATVQWESKWKPIRERRARPGSSLWHRQNRYWYTNFFGRGYIQITWKENYRRFGRLFQLPFVEYPDMVMHPAYGARIAVHGMVRGMFTGKALDDYITEDRQDFVGARWIVNKQDKAEKIARMAQQVLAEYRNQITP